VLIITILKYPLYRDRVRYVQKATKLFKNKKNQTIEKAKN
jgi:hypothetical protein